MHRLLYAIGLLLITDGLPAADVPDYVRDIAPILNKYCVGCHEGDEPEGALDLTSYRGMLNGGENGSAFNMQEPAKSLMLARITGRIEPIMPPEEEPRPREEELGQLLQWLSAGAPGPAAEPAVHELNTPRLAVSSATKPVTAVAYSPAPGHITVRGDGAFTGLDLISRRGELVPIPPGDLTASSAPFRYLLKNSAHRVTFANLGQGVETKIRGDLILPVAYGGKLRDLRVAWGIGNKAVTCDEVLVKSPQAVGRFGEVELIIPAAEETRRKLSTSGKVNDLSFSSDGSMLLAATGIAGLRGEAILWSVSDGQTIGSFSGHSDTLYAAQLSHTTELLATASYDGEIILWNVATGKPLRTLTGHNGAVYDLKFSPDDRVLASASADATVKVWRVDTGQRLDTLSQPLKEQYSVDISPDGQFLVAGGEDNRIRLWRLLSIETAQINPIIHARFAHEAAIHQVRFSADGDYIVSAAADNTLKVWSARSLQHVHSYPTQPDSPQAIAVSSNDRLLVGRMDGSLGDYPLQTSAPKHETRAVTPVSQAAASDLPHREISEAEPNDMASEAQSIRLPVTVSGHINSSVTQPDIDFFRFSARAGETWIVETNAARTGSKLDSHVAIVRVDGQPVPRVQLQAVRDSYFTFRGKDSTNTGDFRLHNWEEMKLNQYLYCSGEVVKLFHYPRGPDSGFNVYPNYGERRGYFDTTPLAHALHETCYIVEPHPPAAELPPNGLPTFVVNFENDDDSQRRLGKDSRLTFVAPSDGDYVVKLRDVRSLQGEDFPYELTIRPPQPDFLVKLLNSDFTVPRNSGRKFGVQAERIDGYDGPISVAVRNLPPGFSVASPLIIEAGHDRAWATLWADASAKTPTAKEAAHVSLVASARIGDVHVEHPIGSLGTIEVDEKAAPLFVELNPDVESLSADGVPVIEIEPGGTTTATIRVRRNGYEGRINFGKEDSAINSPHGVYVDNSGLNGVLIVEGQDQRQFFLTAEPWVQPMERWIFVEASEAGSPTSAPVLLRVRPQQPSSDQQASR